MTEAEPTTGHGNVPISVQALKAGAVECLTEPVGDQIRLDAIGQAVECEVWPASSLHVFPMHVPLLRERPEDIPVLVRHFTHQYARRLHKPTPTIPAEVLAALIRYPWPGNVRELQNVT
jgi:DNA-binding NtrC family response regulator